MGVILLATNQMIKKKVKFERELSKQIEQSILEYISENNSGNDNVSIGNSFCEWILFNIFELREDEVLDAIEISGKFDNGIDAVFEYHGELCVLQSKYNQSHSIDAMTRFVSDCQRLCIEPPLTDRDIVKNLCKNIRESHQSKETINCFYITNNQLSEWEEIQIKTPLKTLDEDFKNLKFHFFDFMNIQEEIEIKKGMLPKHFRNKEISLRIGKNFEELGAFISTVKLRDFADFVEKGGNTLFHSNIRNHLKSTKINQGIKNTLKEEPDNFWYYNNGVTIVCDKYSELAGSLRLTAPQIVNGCQTAKTVSDFFKNKTTKELDRLNLEGYLLVRIIRTKSSSEENEKKELRDKITRYTNSQNAVKGLDFYALDTFQRDLQKKFKTFYGYYYEIQRGSFIAEASSVQKSFSGTSEYNYLLDSVKGTKKFVLPAKEIIQAFTAAIKQLPHVAYGRSNELTPLGSQWDKIINEESKNLPLEHFLFPFLVLKFAKEELKYKSGSDDFRKNSAFLFVTTYYLFINMLINRISEKTFEKPEEINIAFYKKLFVDASLNKELLKTNHKILRSFFRESVIQDEVGDNLRGFLQNKVHKIKHWKVLELKIEQMIDDLEYEDLYDSIKSLISTEI